MDRWSWRDIFPFRRELICLGYDQADILFMQALNIRKRMAKGFLATIALILSATFFRDNGSILAFIFFIHVYIFFRFLSLVSRHGTATGMAMSALAGARGSINQVDSRLVIRATKRGWPEFVYVVVTIAGVFHPVLLILKGIGI